MQGAMPLTAIYAGIGECYDFEVFQHLLDQEIKRSRRYSEFFSLLLISPDYSAGEGSDSIEGKAQGFLALMVENVRQELRDTDFIGRYANDLAVVLLHSSAEEVRVVAERIKERIGRFIFPQELTPGRSRVTFSLGGACFPTDGTDLPSLLQCCLLALQRAKEAGGDRTIMFQGRASTA